MIERSFEPHFGQQIGFAITLQWIDEFRQNLTLQSNPTDPVSAQKFNAFLRLLPILVLRASLGFPHRRNIKLYAQLHREVNLQNHTCGNVGNGIRCLLIRRRQYHGLDKLLRMNTSDLLSHIDLEISRLKEARTLLIGRSSGLVRRGRSAGKRSFISSAGRARIAAAQRKRWAKQKAKK